MPCVRVALVKGEVQAAKAAVSTRHWNVEPVSVEVKVKSGVVSLVEPPAATVPVIVVSGAAVSTVKLREAGVGSTLPAASVARTSKVCDPCVRVALVKGEVQEAKAAASTRHWNVEPVSVEVNVKSGVVSFVEPPAAMCR